MYKARKQISFFIWVKYTSAWVASLLHSRTIQPKLVDLYKKFNLYKAYFAFMINITTNSVIAFFCTAAIFICIISYSILVKPIKYFSRFQMKCHTLFTAQLNFLVFPIMYVWLPRHFILGRGAL